MQAQTKHHREQGQIHVVQAGVEEYGGLRHFRKGNRVRLQRIRVVRSRQSHAL